MAEQDSRGVAASTATEQELQRSSDHFLAELGRIDGMERRKRDLPATDDEGLPLAHEIEDGSIGLVGLSRYQTRLVEMAQEARGVADSPTRKPAVILGEWRAAERALRDARSLLERASDSADSLREEHRRSVRANRSDG